MSTKGLPAGTVGSFDELIEYGDDAIVSRILMKTDGGNVTLFAFDAGQDLSEHTTKFDALAFVVDGLASFTVGENEHFASAGQVVLLPANIPHAVKAEKRFKMVLTMLR